MMSRQHPLHSGFGSETTAVEVLKDVSLQGKVAIVTGGYSGIGLETTQALAGAGACVVVPTRSPDKAREALRGIPSVELADLDLLNPQSIADFAQHFVDSGRPLHMLVNSAGIMAAPLTRDARGYESQFSSNHLGHFQLAVQLWPALCRADGSRVVSVSSRGHHFGGVDFDDPNFTQRDYEKWRAYGQSKTANILFALGLDTRGAVHGVRAFAVHPGRIMSTNLTRFLSNEDLRSAGVQDEHGRPTAAAAGKSVEQGAATSVWCATSARLEDMGGVYCEDVDIASMVAADVNSERGVKPWATDPLLAERLWKLSEVLTGVEFRP